MSLQKVISRAEAQLGVTEYPPGSNMVLYNTAYYGTPVSGDNYKWCVTFLWWVFQQAGEGVAFFNGGKTASCTKLMKLYKAEGRYFTDGQYQAGDIPIMTFAKSRTVQHCGLIVGVAKNGGWYTIEGNTSPGLEGSQDNGGCVAKKVRYGGPTGNILGVCRPSYKEEEPMPKDDITGHWAEDAIRRCMQRKIIAGFPDGTFRPNEPVTRAEAATMIDRLVQLLIGEDDGR